MKHRVKKLVGTMIFVLGSCAYFLFAVSVAIMRLPGTSIATQLLFYLVTTLIWLVFAGLLIRWMERPGSA